MKGYFIFIISYMPIYNYDVYDVIIYNHVNVLNNVGKDSQKERWIIIWVF